MAVRRAVESDLKNIKMLIDRNFDEVMSKYHSIEVIKRFKEHNSIGSLKNQLYWKKTYVAEDAEIITGTGAFANFGSEEQPKYSVSNLYVLPDFHGKGVGTQIMNALIADAKEHRAETFHVPSSRNAVSFYEMFGFAIDDLQPDTIDEITWMTMTL